MLIEPDNNFWSNYYKNLPVDLQQKIMTMVYFPPAAPLYRKNMTFRLNELEHNRRAIAKNLPSYTGSEPIGVLIIKEHPIFCSYKKMWKYVYCYGPLNCNIGTVYESDIIKI